jgi:RNA polymerase sigma-70 factor (ECF subfamily)
MQSLTEVELIARAREADHGAAGELFQRHYSYCLSVASRILRQPDDARDAVQTSFFIAFRHLSRFREDSSFKTWVTRITVNSCLLHLRKLQQRAECDPQDAHPAESPDPEKLAWSRELGSALANALDNLPRHLQEAYSLFAITGLSLQEVASAMGLTISATKTRVFRARAGLRAQLAPVWTGRRLRKAS